MKLVQLLDDVVANEFPLALGKLTIGRGHGCDIRIEDPTVSGQHALLDVKPSETLEGAQDLFIRDMGSTNGTFVNEQALAGPRQLHHDDVVRIAWNRFKVVDSQQQSLAATAYAVHEAEG